MLKNHVFENVIQLYGGMNISDTPDVVNKKGQQEYILNCYNYPTGGIAKLFGRTKHNSSAIGAAAELTGIYELDISGRPFFCIAEAKFYKDNAGTWGDKTGGVTITDDATNLWSFCKFQDNLIATSYLRDSAIEHDGGAGNAANVSNMPAGRYPAAFKNRLFSINTASYPKLAFYSGINDRTSWTVATDYLNFQQSEGDDAPLSGVKEYLDNLIFGKNYALFRCYHTGTTPPFKYYRIGGRTGVLSHYSMLAIPAAGIYPERLFWIGQDNFYQLIGDTVTSIGDDIKPFFSEGAPFQINLSRLPYVVGGLIREKNLAWWSFSSGSNSANDYCFVLDYKNMMWAVCNFAINSFGIRLVSGREYLYSGNYTGFVSKHDPSTYLNNGSAYNSTFVTGWIDFSDSQADKKIRYLIALLDAVGSFDLTVEYRPNLSSGWLSLGTFSSDTGADLLGIDFTLGTSVLGGEDLVDSILKVMKRFKRVQLKFSQGTASEYFRLYALGFLTKKQRGYRIG